MNIIIIWFKNIIQSNPKFRYQLVAPPLFTMPIRQNKMRMICNSKLILAHEEHGPKTLKFFG